MTDVTWCTNVKCPAKDCRIHVRNCHSPWPVSMADFSAECRYYIGWVLSGEEDDLPAADVRPVVRGRDICDTVDGHCEFKCSVCGVELSSVYGGKNDFGLDGGYFNYCPNCGAQMEKS